MWALLAHNGSETVVKSVTWPKFYYGLWLYLCWVLPLLVSHPKNRSICTRYASPRLMCKHKVTYCTSHNEKLGLHSGMWMNARNPYFCQGHLAIWNRREKIEKVFWMKCKLLSMISDRSYFQTSCIHIILYVHNWESKVNTLNSLVQVMMLNAIVMGTHGLEKGRMLRFDKPDCSLQ